MRRVIPFLLAPAVLCLHGCNPAPRALHGCNPAPRALRGCSSAPRMAAAMTSREASPSSASLLELLEEREYRGVLSRAFEKPSAVIDLIRDAGLAGVVAYFIAAATFYSVACTAGELAYHLQTSEWVDPRVLLATEDTPDRAATLALLASFYLACKPFAPLRLCGALVLIPTVQRFIEARPALVAAVAAAGEVWDGTVGAAARAVAQSPVAAPVRRELLKAELLELAAKSEGGIAPLAADERARLYEIATRVLPTLNPTPQPARSALLSAEWECVWTDEKELNFARSSGLLGLPWVRTYQSIDMAAGTLTNVLEFEEGGELRVGSSIAADAADGSRFDFAFRGCSLRWKSLRLPLPPVGRGWGELLYLDGQMRVQRDVRGDLLIGERVGPPVAAAAD